MRTDFGWVIAAGVLLAPGIAASERTQYGWLYGTEVMPERGAEILSWMDEENGRDPDDLKVATWGFSGLVGVTDQLTLGFPLELVWRDSDAGMPSFTMTQYGLEARYRLVASDPVDAPPFAPLVRAAVKRDIIVRDVVVVEADLVASTTTPSGSVMALVDLGFVGRIGIGSTDAQHFELRPGAGVSFKVAGDLRLGAEVYAEISLDDQQETWAVAGPNVAWTHGRFWLSAAFGIGIYKIDTAPRLQWGIMF